MSQSLQERFALKSICFGCGPANKLGLRIRSMADGTATFEPQEHHQAFPGVINGGIIGTLLDCHSNWIAAQALMQAQGLSQPPCTVTAEYAIKLLRPTPLATLELAAKAIEVTGDRAVVEATLSAKGKVCATCRGTFVAVKEGHPAFHRW